MRHLPSSEHWLANPELKKILLTADQVTAWNNAKIQHDSNLSDLVSYPQIINSNKIISDIGFYETSKIAKYYDVNGNHFSDQFVNEIQDLIDLPQPNISIEIRYGYVYKRSNLRTFPTDQIAMGDDLDQDIDRFQETALYPLEPVLVLSTSSDGNWYFVQTYNYRAWIHKDFVIFMYRNDFLKCFQGNRFRYIIKDFFTVHHLPTNQDIQMPMGSRLPLYLTEEKAIDCDLTVKELRAEPMEFSRANILILSFQCLDDPYDWGGKKGYRDCSSFVADVFRCFGITLLRNANQQANSDYTSKCDWSSGPQAALLSNLKPGALIFIPGHVMIYLGLFKGKPYVIHAVKEFFLVKNGSTEKSPLSGVQITPLAILRKNSESYVSNITAVCDY
jgi:hypothetical protein